MDLKIKTPETHKARVMLWTDVSYSDMEVIDNTQSIPELKSTLSCVLEVNHPEPRREALLEVYVQTVLFCRRCKFNKEQTSTLLSIMKSVHEANIETPLNNTEECFTYCKELLLCHSVRRPPFSVNTFSLEEANCILKYIYNSYMRHFKLYKYIYTPQVKLDLYFTYSELTDKQDSFVSAAMEEEAHVVPKNEESPETQETSITEQEETAVDSTSELATQTDEEAGQQMVLVSGQLDSPRTDKI